MDNSTIRRVMRNYIREYGPQDTRIMINKFSKFFNTTKQRISGNLSCMSCIEGSITIVKNKPHSIMH